MRGIVATAVFVIALVVGLIDLAWVWSLPEVREFVLMMVKVHPGFIVAHAVLTGAACVGMAALSE